MFDDQTTMARQARKHSGTGIYHKKMIKERSTLVALLAKNPLILDPLKKKSKLFAGMK